MKKAYLLILCSLGLLTACTQVSKDEEAFQTISTENPNATVQAYQFTYQDTDNYGKEPSKHSNATCNFIIDRCKLRDPGANITVDEALSLIIAQLHPSNASIYAYKFLGYDTLDDGTCYMFAYGKLAKDNSFTETNRYAVSYNKTIYEAKYKEGKVKSYHEVYSLETGTIGHKNNITASISHGTLSIQDKSSRKTISTFSLKKYGLKKAKSEDIVVMDMNFDGYLDVGIYVPNDDTTFTYHAFLYDKKKKRFHYEISYSYLTSPEYSSDSKTILCASKKTDELVYDTYQVVNNQPEILERVSYQYKKDKKVWRMQQYNGKNGNLTPGDSEYYTSKQVSELTGEFVTDN